MPNPFVRIDSARIELERSARGWTKAELARRAGIDAGGLSKLIRRGTCDPRSLRKLIDAFAQEEPYLAELMQEPDWTPAIEESSNEQPGAGGEH